MTVAVDRDWTARARCRGEDPAIFHPQPTKVPQAETDRRQAVHRAQSICRRCPVQLECRTYATENAERHGIWGGIDFQQPENPNRKAANQ